MLLATSMGPKKPLRSAMGGTRIRVEFESDSENMELDSLESYASAVGNQVSVEIA